MRSKEERININAASIEELQRLPGIGPALASRVVEHRRRHGLFKRPQDIVIVRGMSAKLYRRIAHLIGEIGYPARGLAERNLWGL